jgi:ABC-type Fe3+/spermidine/putrescine transport system ATPase subunit
MALSDRIAVMHLGALMQLGAPREVYTHPANRTVADFMGLVNLIPARVARAAGGAAGVGEVAVGGAHPLAVPLQPGAVEGQAVQLAIRPENVRVGAPSEPGLPAKVTEVTFLGNLIDCYATLADGTRVRVQVEADARLEVGQPVILRIETSAVTVFDT